MAPKFAPKFQQWLYITQLAWENLRLPRKTWTKREFRASFSLLSSPPDSGSGTEDGWNTSPSCPLYPLWSYREGAHVGQGWDWLTYWRVHKKGRRSHQSFAVTDVNFCELKLSHQIKEPRLQRAAISRRCVKSVQVIFSSKWRLHCPRSDTNSYFYWKAKDWMKTGKSWSKWDVGEYYICSNKADVVTAPAMWVSCQCYQTHLQNGKSLIVFFFSYCVSLQAPVLLSGQPGMNLLS